MTTGVPTAFNLNKIQGIPGPQGPAGPPGPAGSPLPTVMIGNNADVTVVITASDVTVAMKSLSAARAVNLPASPSVGQAIMVCDEDGSCSPSTGININAGSNHIGTTGQTVVPFVSPYQAKTWLWTGTLWAEIETAALVNPIINGTVEYDGPVYGASNAQSKVFSKQYGVRTVDASVLTITIPADFPCPANGGIDFEADISAKQEGTANYLRMKLALSVVGNGGVWTLVGTLTQSDSRSNGTVTGWAVTAVLHGGTGPALDIDVQGAVAANINWTLLGQWKINTP